VLATVAGAAVGAAAGAAVDRIRRAGIDDAFVDSLRSVLVPGTSALVVLSRDARVDRLAEFLAGTEATLLRAELDPTSATSCGRSWRAATDLGSAPKDGHG
jgi:uncharacterized membrane protein